MKILFLNHKNQRCGVYQYGYRVYDIIKKSDKYQIIYKEIESLNEFHDIISMENPDGIIYNNHWVTMGWLDANNMNKYPNIVHYKICHEDPNVLGFNYFINDMFRSSFNTERPIFENLNYQYIENEIPIIGSFGFGFDNKGFDKICELVNNQFDEAIIRLNMTSSHYMDPNGITSRKNAELCKSKITKDGIKLEFDFEFKTNDEILKFLSENTINVFLYDYMENRGYSSVIDYAISVNRPIAISNSFMFRHIYDPNICVDNHTISEIIEYGNDYTNSFKIKWKNSNLIKTYEDMMDRTLKIKKI